MLNINCGYFNDSSHCLIYIQFRAMISVRCGIFQTLTEFIVTPFQLNETKGMLRKYGLTF